jgi:VanZ family protein
MTTSIRRLLRTAFYIASGLVFALSLVPSAALPPTTIGDKAEHVIAYAVLGLLGGASAERGVVRIILWLTAFGAVIELLQAFSPGRSPDVFDALADVAGACIGVASATILRRTSRAARNDEASLDVR